MTLDRLEKLAAERPCNHDWQIHDVLIESDVLPDTDVWRCSKCLAIRKTVARQE